MRCMRLISRWRILMGSVYYSNKSHEQLMQAKAMWDKARAIIKAEVVKIEQQRGTGDYVIHMRPRDQTLCTKGDEHGQVAARAIANTGRDWAARYVY